MSPQIPEGETAESISEKINNVFQNDGMKRDYEINLSPIQSEKPLIEKVYIKTHLHNLIDLKDGNADFGQAIQAAKQGKKVARAGWNGKNMFMYYVPAAAYPAMTEVGKEIAKLGIENKVQYREYLALKTAQGDVATWAPSGSDALAEDWMIVE